MSFFVSLVYVCDNFTCVMLWLNAMSIWFWVNMLEKYCYHTLGVQNTETAPASLWGHKGENFRKPQQKMKNMHEAHKNCYFFQFYAAIIKFGLILTHLKLFWWHCNCQNIFLGHIYVSTMLMNATNSYTTWPIRAQYCYFPGKLEWPTYAFNLQNSGKISPHFPACMTF